MSRRGSLWAKRFASAFAGVRCARDEREILEDESIAIVTSAAIPSDRAGIGIRAMEHGKDVLMDKPAATTLAQLKELRRIHQLHGVRPAEQIRRAIDAHLATACDQETRSRKG